jgi:hypothetical protein
MKPNTLLKNAPSGIIRFDGVQAKQAWAQAIDATDYPVKIVAAYYQIRDGEFRNANGKTNTDRDKHFNLVLVNKFREPGDDGYQCISTVTGQYGTLKTPTIYEAFRDQLKEMKQDHSLVDLYVSGNGGAQKLTVAMNKMESLGLGIPDNLTMRVRLDTSVDGTKAHTVGMVIHNKTGNTNLSVYGGEYKLSARHTQTIGERTVDFVPSMTTMVSLWNTTIIPMMKLIYDEKFNRTAAVELLKAMGKEAGIGNRHMEKIVSLYESKTVFTNDKSDSLYRVHSALSYYIDTELSKRPELQDRFHTGLAKSLDKRVKKLIAKKKK